MRSKTLPIFEKNFLGPSSGGGVAVAAVDDEDAAVEFASEVDEDAALKEDEDEEA